MQWRRQLSWDPGKLAWRVAALFMIGSSLFALGSFPPYSQLVDPGIVGVTFVIGSLFFTAAGYSQFLQTINAPDVAGAGATVRSFRLWACAGAVCFFIGAYLLLPPVLSRSPVTKER